MSTCRQSRSNMISAIRLPSPISSATATTPALRYHRAADFTLASASMPGGTGTFMLIPPGTPLSSLIISRNQLAGNAVETYLVSDLDITGPLARAISAIPSEPASSCRARPLTRSAPARSAPYSQTTLLTPNSADTFNEDHVSVDEGPRRPPTQRPSTRSIRSSSTRSGRSWRACGSTPLPQVLSNWPLPTRSPAPGPAARNSTASTGT